MDKVWIGSVLRHSRTVARKSIDEAADAAGVSRATISHWEVGRVIPRQEQLVPLAALYGIPYETLLYELGYPISKTVPTLRDWYADRSSEPRRSWRSRTAQETAVSSPEGHAVSAVEARANVMTGDVDDTLDHRKPHGGRPLAARRSRAA